MTAAGSKPRVVCVAGMHRSGTSLATAALEALGVSLGAPEGLLPPGPDNPAGYFENRSIQELDDELLAHLGGSWDRPPVLAPGWEHDVGLEPFRVRAEHVVRRDLVAAADDDRPVAFKDPRVSLLLPFWRTVVDVTATVVVVRDPREVAASLTARNEMTHARSSLLWLRYLLAAVAADRDHLLVTLNDLVDRPEVLDRISTHLGLAAPGDAERAAVAALVDPSLRHHGGAATAFTTAPDPVSALAARVWNDGCPDPGRLDPDVATAVAQGWLRPPGDDAELARARAEAVSFKEQLKRRNAVVKALKEGRPPPPAEPVTPELDAGPALPAP